MLIDPASSELLARIPTTILGDTPILGLKNPGGRERLKMLRRGFTQVHPQVESQIPQPAESCICEPPVWDHDLDSQHHPVWWVVFGMDRLQAAATHSAHRSGTRCVAPTIRAVSLDKASPTFHQFYPSRHVTIRRTVAQMFPIAGFLSVARQKPASGHQPIVFAQTLVELSCPCSAIGQRQGYLDEKGGRLLL